jgi:hydrogenase maturation protease
MMGREPVIPAEAGVQRLRDEPHWVPPCAGTALAPTLVIGIGNPSRGDDALGTLALERLAALALPQVELLTDFQLQVEHALDLAGRSEVIFIDASVSAQAPYEFEPVAAFADASVTTHALSPAAVLDTYRRVIGTPPEAKLLAIRGYAFELGEPLSANARRNLDAAVAMLESRLRERRNGAQSCDARAPAFMPRGAG